MLLLVLLLLVAGSAAFAPAAASIAPPAPLGVDGVLAAIQQVESAGRPWTIFDNSTGQSIALPSREVAEQTASARLQLGHNLDLGLYQINSIQLRRTDVALATIFDPDIQVQLARVILLEFLDRARALYGDSELAWERAIGAYNAGNVQTDNPPYVARVLRAMGRLPLMRPSASIVAAAGFTADVLADASFAQFADASGRGRSAPGGPASDGRFSGIDPDLATLAVLALALLIAGALGASLPLLLRALGATAAVGQAITRTQPSARRVGDAILGSDR
jgi:type IV secretion system protein VirB1